MGGSGTATLSGSRHSWHRRAIAISRIGSRGNTGLNGGETTVTDRTELPSCHRGEGAEIVSSSVDRILEFDDGVTVVVSSTRGLRGGVQISVFSVGGEGSKGREHTAVDHIKFSVPTGLPRTSPKPRKPDFT